MTARTSHLQPGRALATGLGLAAMLALSCCGATEPTPAATVTVWVDPPTQAPPAAPPSESSPAPSTSTSAPTPPTPLTAGHLRHAITSYAQAEEHFGEAESSKQYISFTSPSRNIYCTIASSGAACEVREGRVTPPVDGICPADGPTDVGRLELGPAIATPVCNSDSIREADAPKLAYGRRAEVPGTDIRCLSEEWGVTCVDPRTQHGFWIARGSFATF